ncbi:lipoyl domain-containing protein [Leptolyngbya sp. 7M]|uniref:lipoyl domain-containing protein n=1 Tax=Leptolyngbya sp. 7M TaxID=2812896 RepID=UPI001B8C7D3C|nr:lipoyl domain-containing protein [Leptolyngbya sp. 7M]QYO65189.1 lipoyl domain-containing protein [Leptolyngbya sp. 7M]
MPKLSPTMEEGQIARWVINEGDSFEANETLAEVDTDKATMEMTALSGGTLLKILKPAGDTAALGEAIAIIGQKGEDITGILEELSKNGSTRSSKDKPRQCGKCLNLRPSSMLGSFFPVIVVSTAQSSGAPPFVSWRMKPG